MGDASLELGAGRYKRRGGVWVFLAHNLLACCAEEVSCNVFFCNDIGGFDPSNLSDMTEFEGHSFGISCRSLFILHNFASASDLFKASITPFHLQRRHV